MITIILSTSNRLYYLKNTINDLTKFSKIIDKVIIITFNDLKTENYIKKKFSRKFKKIIFIKSKNNMVLENRIKYISLYKTELLSDSKYIWFMNDKDRILFKNYKKIKKILIKNINGLTMNSVSLNNKFLINEKKENLRLFDLEKGIHKLGLISSQIFEKKLFLKYSKNTPLSAYYLAEIILKIIINEKNWFFFTNCIIGYTHINKDKIINKMSREYLNYRVDQEINFYTLTVYKFLKSKNYLNKIRILNKGFFKNVLSWLLLLKRNETIFHYSKKILKLINNLNNLWLFKIILLLTIFIPNFVLDLFKKFKHIV